MTAIVPIWVLDPRLDTIADTFGSQNVRKGTNVCPNVSGIAVCPILADPNRNMSTANNYTIQKFRDLFHALPVNVL